MENVIFLTTINELVLVKLSSMVSPNGDH